MTTTLLSR